MTGAAASDRAAVGDGLDLSLRHPGEVVRLMRVLQEEVRRAIALGSVAPLMEYLYANMAKAATRTLPSPLACRPGCSHCCNGFVAATTVEVLHVVASLPPDGRDHARNAIGAAAAATRDATPEQRLAMVTPCVFLADDRCSVYEARPIVCRTAVSLDAGACSRVHRDLSGEAIPKPVAWVTMRRAYHVALAGALKQAGLSYRAYEYNAALAALIAAPDATARWLAGEDVCAGLPEDAGSDPFDDPVIRGVYGAAFGVEP